MWTVIGAIAAAALFVIGAFCALRAAQTARTPQGAVGWVVFLLTAPYLAVPAYLFLGQHRYRGYHIARRESAQVMQNIKEFSAANAPEPDGTMIPPEPFEYCANLPAVRGNGVKLLIDGAETFEAIFAAIDSAKSYVLIQFYTIEDDELGRAFQKRLIAAAARGVKVRLMVDAIGSMNLTGRYTNTLREAGVKVVDRHWARRPLFRFRINFRNHRKSVIVDGRVAFTGGLNVGDAYLGKHPVLGAWRDTHAEMTGPMVSQLQLIFSEDWHWMTGDVPVSHLNWSTEHADEDLTGLIVATGPGDISETGSLMFFSAIAAAKSRIWLSSPYFVPDTDIVTALRHAALRGVDVRILVPDQCDHTLPWLAAFSYFDDVREAGVRVFRYDQGFLHQKVFVVDDGLAAIGTTNLDNRSFRLNFEAMALFFDARTARKVDEMLRKDFARSHELTLGLEEQRAFIRYGAPLARLFSPLL